MPPHEGAPSAEPEAEPTPELDGAAAPPQLDSKGRYHAHGTISGVTLGVYVVIVILLLAVVLPSGFASNAFFLYLIVAGTLFFLVRYLTTNYTIDDSNLTAWRILGPRRMPLSEIRKIELMALRDLSPTGFFGSWGYRGRMWSPYISTFDAIYTDPVGILVSGGAYPLFISPRHREDFARELSRRARSYGGELTVDHGRPVATAADLGF
jgi:hypothetical protein